MTAGVLPHYPLQTTVYNPSTRTPLTFPMTAFFKSRQLWANFPSPNVNTHVFVTDRIFGLAKEDRQLAVMTDDIHFLQTSTETESSPQPSTTTLKTPWVPI